MVISQDELEQKMRRRLSEMLDHENTAYRLEAVRRIIELKNAAANSKMLDGQIRLMERQDNNKDVAAYPQEAYPQDTAVGGKSS